MCEGPASYKHALDMEESGFGALRGSHIDVGKALHSLVLGGARVIAYDKPTRMGKAWAAFQEKHPGAICLTSKEYDRVQRMQEAIYATPGTAQYLDGHKELEVFWSWMGRECVSHIDVLGKDFVCDLKTTRDALGFKQSFYKFHYNAQLAFYRRATYHFRGNNTPTECAVIAVKSSVPYDVRVLRIKEPALDLGDRQCERWLSKVIECEQTGCWD